MSRVLVIDDEEAIRELLVELLGNGDDPPIVAATLAEARQALAIHDVDVALVDKNLPDGSGLDLVAELRAQRPFTESIVITGYASIDSAIQALEAGAFDYLIKPFRDVQDVVVRVRNARDRSRMARDRAELVARLAESEERYRRQFESSCDAILVHAVDDDRILDANAAAAELLGYQRAELIGMSRSRLRPDGAADDAPFALERMRRRDGVEVPVEVTRNRYSVGGRLVGAQALRDVSDRVRADEERRRLEAQLVEAQKMEAMGCLASGLAHDFNNLLSVVLGYGRLLLDTVSAQPGLSEAAEDCECVIRAGEEAANLTKQLLTFSRREVVTPVAVDLSVLVAQTCGLLARTLGRSVTITTDLAADLPAVRLDRSQGVQVLTNLLINAKDAMPDGGSIRVRTAVEDGWLVLQVIDSGCGIPPEHLDRIFEPFFTTKGPGKGTGLGLAVVHGIVNGAGGQVLISSGPTGGTTFTLRFPPLDAVVAEAEPVSPPTTLEARGETVVVVDDDADVRRLVCRILTGAGYRVLDARRGVDAIDLARSELSLDLVVSDVVMPGMYGPEVTREIRRILPRVRAIHMTGYLTEPLVRDQVAGGGVALLAKPFSATQLLTLVRRTLDAERGSGPVRQPVAGDAAEHAATR